MSNVCEITQSVEENWMFVHKREGVSWFARVKSDGKDTLVSSYYIRVTNSKKQFIPGGIYEANVREWEIAPGLRTAAIGRTRFIKMHPDRDLVDRCTLDQQRIDVLQRSVNYEARARRDNNFSCMKPLTEAYKIASKEERIILELLVLRALRSQL